ncbi:MAG: 2-amino-4-hydroxy-6-hydroxymethyldihydropteridine diphosphokinase [Cytophagales bacterium]|nr:2-amino-4-hydroxy-6-hydroxymethyldihydropteridine diphosphokinase [Cytophagales bacterium]
MQTNNENTAYLLLGSNLGERISLIKNAALALEDHGLQIQKSSKVYETEPWGLADQNSFLNQVIKIKTSKSAQELLDTVLGIEKNLGRERIQKWGSRTMDIDILYFNDSIISLENLTVPHPQIEYRRFTLIPLCEIAPDFLHPVFAKSNRELLRNCDDQLKVTEYQLLDQ